MHQVDSRGDGRTENALPRVRGVQYVSITDTERLAEAGIAPSVESVGDSYDCESVGAVRRP